MGEALVERFGFQVVKGAIETLHSLTVENGVKAGIDKAFDFINGEVKTASPDLLKFERSSSDGSVTYGVDLPDGQAGYASFITGDGALSSKTLDLENKNGTSSIKTYGADGSSHTAIYSGPNGTGDVTNERDKPTKQTGFSGQQVAVDFYYPMISDSNRRLHDQAIVGLQIEFTGSGSQQSDVRLTPGYSDLSSDSISVHFPTSEEGTTLLAAPFNGDVYTLLDSNAPRIAGASVTGTNISGFGSANLAFSDHSSSVNLAGLTLPANEAAQYDIHVDFAPRHG